MVNKCTKYCKQNNRPCWIERIREEFWIKGYVRQHIAIFHFAHQIRPVNKNIGKNKYRSTRDRIQKLAIEQDCRPISTVLPFFNGPRWPFFLRCIIMNSRRHRVVGSCPKIESQLRLADADLERGKIVLRRISQSRYPKLYDGAGSGRRQLSEN